MLRVAYISSTDSPVKKVSKADQIKSDTAETLAVARFNDRIKAIELFAAEQDEIHLLEAEVSALEKQLLTLT